MSYLDAGLPCHTSLHLHHCTTDLVAHAWLTALMVSRCGRVVGMCIRSHRPSSSMTMMVETIGMCLSSLSCLLRTSDWVLGALGGDLRLVVVCGSLPEAVHNARFPCSGGGASAGHDC